MYAIEEYGFRYLRNDTVHAREPGSRWMHHAEMDRAPLWQPETTVAQSSNAARIQTIPQFASVASSPSPDVLSRSFHNRSFHAIDTRPKDYDSPVWIACTNAIKLSRASTLFSFFISQLSDRSVSIYLFFFERTTTIVTKGYSEEICLRVFPEVFITRWGDTRKSVFDTKRARTSGTRYLESSIAA